MTDLTPNQPRIDVRFRGQNISLYPCDLTPERAAELSSNADAWAVAGDDMLATRYETKSAYIKLTLTFLKDYAELTATYAAAEAEAHGIGTADDDTPLHDLARAFMATRTDLELLSLDEWLAQHHAKLSPNERAAGFAILALF